MHHRRHSSAVAPKFKVRPGLLAVRAANPRDTYRVKATAGAVAGAPVTRWPKGQWPIVCARYNFVLFLFPFHVAFVSPLGARVRPPTSSSVSQTTVVSSPLTHTVVASAAAAAVARSFTYVHTHAHTSTLLNATRAYTHTHARISCCTTRKRGSPAARARNRYDTVVHILRVLASATRSQVAAVFSAFHGPRRKSVRMYM